MELDSFAIKAYLGMSFLQVPMTTGYNWEFWVEKALTVGVLIWIVQDMKKNSKETARIHNEQLKAKDEQFKELHENQVKQLTEVHNNYKEVIATISEQHKTQIELLKSVMKE